MQQHAVRFDAGKRDQRRNGDLETEQDNELLDGHRQHLVGAEGEPVRTRRSATGHMEADLGGAYQKSAESTHAVFSQPDDKKTRASML